MKKLLLLMLTSLLLFSCYSQINPTTYDVESLSLYGVESFVFRGKVKNLTHSIYYNVSVKDGEKIRTSQPDYTSSSIFNKSGNLLRVTDSSRNRQENYTCRYDAHRNLIEEKHYDVNDNSHRKTNYKYDSNDNLIEEKIYNESNNLLIKRDYKYNYNNNLIEEKYYDVNDNRHNKTTYKYDSNDNLIEEKKYEESNNLHKKTNYKYDSNDNLIEEKNYKETTWGYDSKGNDIRINKKLSLNRKRIYEYDNNGNEINLRVYHSKGILYNIIYVYNNSGQEIKRTISNSSDKEDKTIIYKYDNNGNKILQGEYVNRFNTKPYYNEWTYEYKFDNKGNKGSIIFVFEYCDGEFSNFTEYKIEYYP